MSFITPGLAMVNSLYAQAMQMRIANMQLQQMTHSFSVLEKAQKNFFHEEGSDSGQSEESKKDLARAQKIAVLKQDLEAARLLGDQVLITKAEDRLRAALA